MKIRFFLFPRMYGWGKINKFRNLVNIMSKSCTKCNKCTEACPIAAVTKQDQIWGILFNQNIDVWNCSSCFRCESSCPVNLSVREALFERRRHLKQSAIPPKIAAYSRTILETGFVFPVDEPSNESRTDLGLEPVNFNKIKTELKRILADSE
jgi:heterodisulfide reductase subunit C